MRQSLSVGQVRGAPLMKFTLIYDGPLESAGNKPKKDAKWDVRKYLDPQLRKLWDVNLDLAHLRAAPQVRTDGREITTKPHPSAYVSAISSTPLSSAVTVGAPVVQNVAPPPGMPPQPELIDLCAPISRGGKEFLPLVRNSLCLTCGLTILFLRQESRGKVYQGGDLDGRVKLLLDALSVPQNDNEVCEDPTCPQPLYCLAENDVLFTRLDVRSEQLLSPPSPTAREDWVRLVVEVDVRVMRHRTFNDVFLAD